MRRSGWYRPALLGAIAIVLLNTWLAARALETLLNSQKWLTHTLEVIDDTRQVIAQVRTAEAAARGYILTASPGFQQQYDADSANIDGSIGRLQALTLDNPSQQQRIAELRRRVAAKLAVLEAGMAVRRGHPTGPLDPLLLGAVVDDTPDRVEGVQMQIRSIREEEGRLLALRTQRLDDSRRQVRASFGVAFLLDFILLVAAYQLLGRIARDRERIAAGAEEILSLNAELKTVNAELEERVQQRTRELAFSNQELEAFSYSVSHDLRAPLRTVDGFSLALQEDFAGALNDEGRDYIARIRNGVQRMGTLIDALLQLSRVTRTELQAEDVDLSRLSELVFRELEASDPGRQADPERRVTFHAQPDLAAKGDPRLLRIALENLLGNAWKFTSRTPHPCIEFGSEERDGTRYFFVRDNGAGFDMQYVDRLFTAFQRLHGERDFKGSGIGLATVSRIVHRHQGSIGAESGPGNGAKFYFNLNLPG